MHEAILAKFKKSTVFNVDLSNTSDSLNTLYRARRKPEMTVP